MLDLETRKNHTKSIIKLFKDGLYKINPNHKVNGLAVLILHWLCVGVPGIGLLLFKLDWNFYLSAAVWIIICGLHVLHNGVYPKCICNKHAVSVSNIFIFVRRRSSNQYIYWYFICI